jgi:ankyrin repeat protein
MKTSSSLAKQLIKHGANVNVSIPDGATPLAQACHCANVTNLDFVELLLKKAQIQMLKTIRDEHH